jgi:hypothetical protein
MFAVLKSMPACIRNRYDPNFIELGRPTFISRCMNQSVPYAGIENTITVSLILNQALAESVRRILVQTVKGMSLCV